MAAQGYFLHDLTEAILVRIPAKSLIRFKSVSKQWNLLVSDPIFIKTHKAKSSSMSNHMTFFVCGIEAKSVCALRIASDCSDFDRNVGTLRVAEPTSPLLPNEKAGMGVAHCDGLLCAVNRDLTVVIWNPSINEHRRFDLPRLIGNTWWLNPYALGFGYVLTNDDYKVVVLSSYNYVILSLKTGFLKCVPQKQYLIQMPYQIATPFNGCLYWGADDSIICFDLERDELTVEEDKRGGILGILGENLCLTRNGYLGRCSDVWIRKEEGWSKLFSISVTNPYVTRNNGVRIICSVGDDKILISKAEHGDLFLYNVKDSSIKKITVIGPNGKYMYWKTIVSYEVSLISPCRQIHRLNRLVS